MKNGEGARDSSGVGPAGMYQPGLSNVGRRIRVGEATSPEPRCLAWCPCPSEPRVPELCVGLGGWGLGLVWQQAPIRQLESASACPAICPRPPGSRPPSAYPRRPAVSAVRPRSLARRGRRRPVLPLFIPISFSALALRTSCQVHEVCSATSSRWFCGVAVGRKGACVWRFLSTVCLFASLGTFVPPPSPFLLPPLFFFLFLL